MPKQKFTIKRKEHYTGYRTYEYEINERYAEALTQDFYQNYRFTDRLNLPIPITVQDIYAAFNYEEEDNEFLSTPVERINSYYTYETTVADVIRDFIDEDLWEGDVIDEHEEGDGFEDGVSYVDDAEEGED